MRDKLVSLLCNSLPRTLSEELVSDYLLIRQDVASCTLGRTAPGKFVETVVQVLQYLNTSTYETKPNVDQFLRSIQSTSSHLDDGLRICSARISRSMYALRSKRNIAHKGDIDPNLYDLQYLHHAAQWILAEIVRSVSGTTMDDAGKIIQQLLLPVGSLIEDFGNRKIVLADLSTTKEILVLLHSDYPALMTSKQLIDSLDRKNRKTVVDAIRTLWKNRLIEGVANSGHKLTRLGIRKAVEIIGESVSL